MKGKYKCKNWRKTNKLSSDIIRNLIEKEKMHRDRLSILLQKDPYNDSEIKWSVAIISLLTHIRRSQKLIRSQKDFWVKN